MKITVVTIAYNEAEIIEKFVRHYKQFADRIVVYDNMSTDKTAALAKEHGCEVLQHDGLTKKSCTDLQNSFLDSYKDCDYLFVVDADEFIYHQNMLDFLQQAKKNGISSIELEGYEMFSDAALEANTDLVNSIKNGVRNIFYDKKGVLSPSSFERVKFCRGLHFAEMKGNIVKSDEKLKLLHYKFIGGLERVIQKHGEYQQRLSHDTAKNNLYTPENTRKYYEYLKSNAIKVL